MDPTPTTTRDLTGELATARLALRLHRANFHARLAEAHELRSSAAALNAQARHVGARSRAIVAAGGRPRRPPSSD